MTVVLVAGGGILSLGNHALLRFGRERYATAERIGEEVALRLTLFSITYVVVAGIVLSIFPWLAPYLDVPSSAFGWILLGLLIIPLGEMATFAAQATERFAGYGPAPALARGLQLAALGVIVVLELISWHWILICMLLGYAASGIWTWTRLPDGALRGFLINGSALWRFTRFGLLIPVASLSIAVMGSVDLWFLRAYQSADDTGTYAWVYAVAMMGTALLAPLGALLANRYLDMVRKEEHENMDTMLVTTHAIVLLSIGLCVVASGFFLIGLSGSAIYLGQYASAIGPGAILIAGIAFQLGTNMWESIAFGQESRVWKASLILLCMAIVNGLMDWLFIPEMGALGAAISTATAFLAGAVGLYVLVQLNSPRREWWPPFQLALFGGLSILIVGNCATMAPVTGGTFAFSAGLVLIGASWVLIGSRARRSFVSALLTIRSKLGTT
ncbi:MAG: hypothetical protein HOC63_05390 [Rhodospirillales bacterium]|nr:hypothetical protein [Rhodospirillales bacterium]MBT6109366.1 hypothetical protein [Rhodospirillales bacterium]